MMLARRPVSLVGVYTRFPKLRKPSTSATQRSARREQVVSRSSDEGWHRSALLGRVGWSTRPATRAD
eukprot:7026434-Prymnesium_polylepis.1